MSIVIISMYILIINTKLSKMKYFERFILWLSLVIFFIAIDVCILMFLNNTWEYSAHILGCASGIISYYLTIKILEK